MLDLYENIKKRREELGFTQSDLAKRAGYADKTMISKIEKGQVDLPQSKIEAIADALFTTPAILMGIENRGGWSRNSPILRRIYQNTLADKEKAETEKINSYFSQFEARI